jgi:hypothetical protein
MNELAGLWRADRHDGLYRRLLIDDDGTGWTEAGRGSEFQIITEFTWTSPGPGRVEFAYGACREVEEGRVSHTWPGRERSAHHFTISGQDGPEDTTVLLTLDEPIMSATEFSRTLGPVVPK